MSVDVTEKLGSFAFRQAVIEVLRERAGINCTEGDRALFDGRYKLAVGHWQTAAGRNLAAKALEDDAPVRPDHQSYVEQACAEVLDRPWTARTAQGGGRA